MALQSRYTAVPAVPLVGVDEWQSQLLNALKENVELLTGTRGEPDLASVALNPARLTVAVPPEQSMRQVSANGSGAGLPSGFEINSDGSGGFTVDTTGTINVPVLEDYTQLITDVQELANDVANLRATVEVLIAQLRG